MKARILSWCLLLGLMPALALAGDAASIEKKNDAPIGKKIADFTGRDYRGKEVSLSDTAGAKAIVVVFLGTECPLAKLYAPRLVELEKQFASQGVKFIGIDSNRQDLGTEVAHYAREAQIEFPLLKDAGNSLADLFGAQRTPEAFVLDKDHVVRYHGRIDDQYGFMKQGIAYQRTEPNRRDLAEAIGEVVAGKNVSEPLTAVQGCLIGRVKEPVANSEVTYSNQIARIFNANCVECHRAGQIAPFPLTSYDEAVGWADMIQEVVQDRRMPPWHADPAIGTFSNDCRLSEKDLAAINTWVKNGAPEGDPKDLPAAPQFTEGWQIPKPDAVICMADEPYNVPAEGTVEYQRFVVDPGWTEDKWIKAMECRPGNHAVVHHIIVYLIPPGVAPTGRAGRLQTNWLGAFAPGLRQEPLPEGYARYVQKGSKLLFEMHYTPNGVAQQDRSCAAFVFADPATVKKEVAVQNAGNFTFKIPPQDPNYEVESEFVFRQPATLLTISPHMHVRGKDFLYELIYPDGKKETLLWVPRYDFGWQTTYWLTEPKQIPRGAKMHCVAHFDNSPDNLANPDPNATVQWGEQTWEEMMFGWFEMALSEQDLTAPATDSALRVKEFLKQAQGDAIQIDAQLKQLAPKALENPKSWELVTWQVLELVPQVDRMCVTCVDGDKLRLKVVQDRIGLKTPFHSTSTVAKAQGDALADYALDNKVVINDSLVNVKGPTMNKMAKKDIRSSMHVPVTINGQRCTVNFWSTEEGAFPPEAAQLLEQIAHLVADGPAAK